MSWLIKRGPTFYIGFKDAGKDRYVSTKTADKTLAETRLMEFDLSRRIQNRPADALSPNMPFDALIGLYKKEADIQAKTLVINEYSWRRFKEDRGDLTIGSVTAETAKDFKSSMIKQKYSAASVSLWLRDLRKLFGFAVEKGLLGHNPFRRIELPATQEVYRFVTKEEETALVAAANPLMQRIIPFALETGLRLSQIVHLTWKQVDLAAKLVHIPSQKRQKPRTIPLFDGALRSMGPAHIAGQVFTGTTEDMVKKMWNRTKRRARIQGRMRFHDLRHTCASRLAQVLSAYELRDFFGWSSVQLVDRYTHTRASDIREKLSRLL